MRLALGCDHAGPAVIAALATRLSELGHTPEHLGTAGTESVDYPDYAVKVAEAVRDGRADLGVLVCGTGIGMAMAANKVRGVRAAVVHDEFTAEYARRHNCANVICLGARVLDTPAILALVELFLSTPFDGDLPDGDRHLRRVGKIDALDA